MTPELSAQFQPFLRAIIARRDDDLPRLIAADWLDEHGCGERAEFIRLQIELAKGMLAVRWRRFGPRLRPSF